MTAEQKPIFEPMDRYPGPVGKEEERVVVLLRASDLLSKMDVDQRLVNEIRQIEPYLLPIGTLTISALDKPLSEHGIDAEGRGQYHAGIPISIFSSENGEETKLEVNAYNKGIGSEDCARLSATRDSEVDFPGFPQTSDDHELFCDNAIQSALPFTPRVNGALITPIAVVELNNACAAFATHAKTRRWASVEDVVRDQGFIPIAAFDYPALSKHIEGLLDQGAKQSIDELASFRYAWQGNRLGHGSTEVIVPSTKRNVVVLESRAVSAEEVAQLGDTENWATTGATLCDMVQSGLFFIEPSSHGQNIYYRARTYADYEDVRFLAEPANGVVNYPSSYRNQKLTQAETATCSIYCSLNRQAGMTPGATSHIEHGMDHKRVIDCQKAFWQAFLPSDIAPEALDCLGKLALVARGPVVAAAARLAVQASDKNVWEQTQRNKIKGYEVVSSSTRFKFSGEMLPMDIRFGGREVAHVVDETAASDLGVLAIEELINTGNVAGVKDHAVLGPLLRLAEAIEKAPVSLESQIAINAVCNQTKKPFLAGEEKWLDHKPVVDNGLVSGEVADKISTFIENGQFESIPKFLKALGAISEWESRDFINPNTSENYQVVFRQKLLKADLRNMDELNREIEKVGFLYKCYSCIGYAGLSSGREAFPANWVGIDEQDEQKVLASNPNDTVARAVHEEVNKFQLWGNIEHLTARIDRINETLGSANNEQLISDFEGIVQILTLASPGLRLVGYCAIRNAAHARGDDIRVEEYSKKIVNLYLQILATRPNKDLGAQKTRPGVVERFKTKVSAVFKSLNN